jgi:hypothetical protein
MEAEHGITNGTITYRGGTSNKLTVRLSEGQYVIWGFVTESSCMLKILNVEYTNDGLSDTITLYINGEQVGSFETKAQSNHGHLWNDPVSSGSVGNETTLSSGDHTVKLTVSKMDEYGIEVDRIILALICTNDVSNSDGMCPKSQEPDVTPNNDSWSRGHIIAVSIGVASIFLTSIGVIVGLITLITGLYFHCKSLNLQPNDNNPRSNDQSVNHAHEPHEQEPLLKTPPERS